MIIPLTALLTALQLGDAYLTLRILANGGSHNTLQQARWEASSPKVLYSSDNANQGVDNLIVGGYNVNQIQFTMGSTTAGYNKVLGGRACGWKTHDGFPKAMYASRLIALRKR